ncbi:polyprotein [Arachis hypogaea]|nr:polyprotein [Arachis hypogaea]
MPKKATLASVRGRGICLALPGPTKKSGSSTPAGSSTQQPSPLTQEPTGSSTQIIKNVVESSTQPPKILPPPADEGFKIFTKKFDQQESTIPADLQFFSVFSLAWVFSWQYRYGKQEHPKAPPMLQRNAYVKWWSQFDAAMAHPDKVRSWFKEHPKFTKPFDHEESVFLNQKAQIAAALAGAQSKETLARHLQQIMQMIDEDKKHKDDPTPSEESSSDYNQNEDDCFGINLGEGTVAVRPWNSGSKANLMMSSKVIMEGHEEEVCFEDINQAIDNWEIPKIPQDELYVPDDNKRKSDYIIKTAENNIPLGPDSGEEFHLLTKQSVREHARHYRYLHIGCVQVAVKPLIREGLNASILMCLRDIRHNDFQDSLIGTVKTSLGHGPVYFNCFPNKTVSLLDLNILDSLFLNIRIHGLNMKEGSIPAALIYRIQFKVMNTCNSRVLLKSQDRETTLFVTDMTKANVMIPRLIRWDEIDLPQSWSIDQAIPTQPRQAPLLREVKQDESGKVEIFFDRRNSFSSRSEAGTSNDFASARRSFSVTFQSQFSKISRPANSEIHISGLQNNSNISQGVYQEDDGDVEFEVESSIPSHQSPTYSSLNGK